MTASSIAGPDARGTMATMPNILVIDDEPGMRSMVRLGLEAEGHRVSEAADGPSGLASAVSGDFDLVILDLGLPMLAGESVLEQVVRVRPDLPVIVVTAKDGVDDRVGALDRGAQDYLVKPFALAELQARVRRRIRASSSSGSSSGTGDINRQRPTVVHHGRVSVDLLRRCATVDGEDVLLTQQECALLEQFLRQPEEVLSRSELLLRVWGLEQAPRRSNLVDVAIAQLRRRIGADTIETVRGEGYRFIG
jgi:DNA-binding response OmpR family regulator